MLSKALSVRTLRHKKGKDDVQMLISYCQAPQDFKWLRGREDNIQALKKTLSKGLSVHITNIKRYSK